MAQPDWKCIGHIGDVDPIAYGGGFVYIDRAGVYPPKVTWFEPAPDEDWHETESETPVTVYRFILEPTPSDQWWFDKLGEVAKCCGQSKGDYLMDLASDNPMKHALVYWDMIGYFGIHEFDSYPVEMTEREAYNRHRGEMRKSLGLHHNMRVSPPWRFDLVSNIVDCTDYRDDIRGVARFGITFTKAQGYSPHYADCHFHADIELGEPFGATA